MPTRNKELWPCETTNANLSARSSFPTSRFSRYVMSHPIVSYLHHAFCWVDSENTTSGFSGCQACYMPIKILTPAPEDPTRLISDSKQFFRLLALAGITLRHHLRKCIPSCLIGIYSHMNFRRNFHKGLKVL